MCALVGLMLLAWDTADARKFFPDDPLPQEPPPMKVEKVKSRKINEYYDFLLNTFFEPDKPLKKARSPRPSAAINTLGEVPDNAWFTNRIGTRRMSIEEVVRGPGDKHAPSMDAPWTVVSGKNEGISLGLVITDGAKHKYVLKFDPISNPEMASATDVIGSRFFYALGYNVPENYIVYFTRKQLVLSDKSKINDYKGEPRQMNLHDIDNVLAKVPRDKEGRYRGMASAYIAGDIVGPFKYYKTRHDDPNDLVPHEDRRDLRGLYVFAAWLNHTDTKSINSLDSVVEENGRRFVKHFLIDFGAILGSDSFEAKSPRAGNVYLFDFKPAAVQFLTLGFDVNRWMTAHYPDIPAVGRLEWKAFDPEHWKNNYPNPAFDMRTPGDTYWAAKKVMAVTDEQIRAMVETGQYTDPRAVDWITKCLIERRNKIGRAFLNDVLPLDNFRVSGGQLEFEDLGVRYNVAQPRRFTIEWSTFDNERESKTPIAGASGPGVPRSNAEYLAADIRGDDTRKTVTVYLRGSKVVGIDRSW